ncbi:MAG: alkaline phosphatase family protein, partial [Bacteroidota bacterium]
MNKSLAVINVVALTPSLLGENTPHLNQLIEKQFMAPMKGVFPAVTCPAQASMLTGLLPKDHGIVGNGWYDRDFAEIKHWQQS